MDVDNLVHMANRIGEFFQAMPDRGEALEGIATHLRKFWEPRMRRQLAVHIDQQGGAGLAPLVLEAFVLRRADLVPAGGQRLSWRMADRPPGRSFRASTHRPPTRHRCP